MLLTMPAEGVIVRPIRNHGHNQFARDISAEDQYLGSIELRRVNKLAKAYIRTMNIRREIQTHSAHKGNSFIWSRSGCAWMRHAQPLRDVFYGSRPKGRMSSIIPHYSGGISLYACAISSFRVLLVTKRDTK